MGKGVDDAAVRDARPAHGSGTNRTDQSKTRQGANGTLHDCQHGVIVRVFAARVRVGEWYPPSAATSGYPRPVLFQCDASARGKNNMSVYVLCYGCRRDRKTRMCGPKKIACGFVEREDCTGQISGRVRLVLCDGGRLLSPQ